MQLIQVHIQPIGHCCIQTLHLFLHYFQLLFRRIVEHIFQHVVLLGKHGLRIRNLHMKVFELYTHTFQIHFQCHSVFMESTGYGTQFLKPTDIVVNDGNLLRGILNEVIYFANLHDKVFACLIITEPIDVVHQLGHIDARVQLLVIERHLQLQANRCIVLQSLGYIV